MIFLIFFGADFNFLGNLPYVKGAKSPFHQKVKTNFKKNFHSGGIFRLPREFTLRWKETKKLLSHLYNGKKGEKRFMENQQLVKYFDFFHFFGTKNRAPGFLLYVKGIRNLCHMKW